MLLSHTLCWLLQVEDVCKTLAGFPELKHGYNAIGFSQGMPLLTKCKPEPCHLHSRRFVQSSCKCDGSPSFARRQPECYRAAAAGLARMALLIIMHYFTQVVSS